MNAAQTLGRLAPQGGRLGRLLGDEHLAELGELEQRLGVGTEPEPVQTMASELFAAGGKRLRGLVALAVGKALGLPREQTVRLAELVELTHGATLLHDDVIDEADRRRGRPAARVRWSNSLAVLGGDFVLLRALERVAEVGSPALAEAHRATLRALLGAEVAQHVARTSEDWSVAGYLAIARGKTGALFALACAAPALCGGDSRAAAALERFGSELGVAFQIADDLRDVLGLDSTKPAGLDLADAVPSLPIRLAAEASPAVREQLRRCVNEAVAPPVLELLRRDVVAAGGVAAAARLAHEHLALARQALDELGERAGLELLTQAWLWLDRELARCEGGAP